MSIYEIDRKSDTPLYLQIYNNIEEAISCGSLKIGDKLPSVASLAKEIGVTQATVRRALKDLGSNGRTRCKVGSGTFIVEREEKKSCSCNDEATNLQERVQDNSATFASGCNPREFAARRLRMGVSKALLDIMSLRNKPGIIDLTKGVPDPSLLAENFMDEIAMDTLQREGSSLIEATEPLGNYELRQEIATRFSSAQMQVSPDQVLITNGSMQAITLIAEAAMGKKRGIICETPCFKGMTDTFSAKGHWVETVTRDHKGPIMAQLNNFSAPAGYLLYLCPYVHNPMGTNLSVDRYEEVAGWAKRTGSIVVMDEIFKDLQFHKTGQPSLMETLGGEQSIAVSSLSKSIMTGLRVGWLISSKQRVQQISQLKRLMDHCCPTFIQGLALSIFRSGKHDEHIQKMRSIYESRMQTLLVSLKKLMPKEIRWSVPDGGFSIMLELPKGYSSVALFLAATEKGASLLPGPLFDIDQRFVHSFRLSTAWSDENQIREGVELLANAVEEYISHPPGDSGLSGLGSYQ